MTSDPVAAALADYLGARPAVGTWEAALSDEAPLVCARRGSPDSWQRTGLAYHSVVVKPLFLSHWVGQCVAASGPDVLPFGGSVGGGAQLLADLLALPGVELATSATPLLEPGRNHRLTRWLRIDSDNWPVRLPDDLDEVVTNPWGT